MEVYGQRWWKFPRYGVRDGYIVPVGRSPSVDVYYPSESDHESRLPPFLEAERVPDPDRTDKFTPPSAEEVERLIAWHDAYGPLGVLLSRVVEVVLPQGTRHTFVGTGWNSRSAPRVEPGATMRDLSRSYGEGRERWERLSESWWSFFPSRWPPGFKYSPHVRATQAPGEDQLTEQVWPEPGTAEFFEEYRESIPDFMEGAMALRDAINWAQDARDPSLPPSGRYRSLVQLNHLQAPARRVVFPADPRGVSLRFIAPSLLSLLAMLFADDLAAGREFRFCARAACRRLFRVSDRRARYCSKRCNDAQKQSAYRKRLAGEQDRGEGGES